MGQRESKANITATNKSADYIYESAKNSESNDEIKIAEIEDKNQP